MTRIWPWLLPTFAAPMLGASAYVLFLSRGSSIPTIAWLLAAGVAAGFAVVVAMMMVAIDVSLLKLKLRQLPTGWRVWVMGLTAPLPVFWCWKALVRYAITGWLQLFLVFFLPMLVTALVMRVALGTRPTQWVDKKSS